jgi:hypothetical protein
MSTSLMLCSRSAWIYCRAKTRLHLEHLAEAAAADQCATGFGGLPHDLRGVLRPGAGHFLRSVGA